MTFPLLCLMLRDVKDETDYPYLYIALRAPGATGLRQDMPFLAEWALNMLLLVRCCHWIYYGR